VYILDMRLFKLIFSSINVFPIFLSVGFGPSMVNNLAEEMFKIVEVEGSFWTFGAEQASKDVNWVSFFINSGKESYNKFDNFLTNVVDQVRGVAQVEAAPPAQNLPQQDRGELPIGVPVEGNQEARQLLGEREEDANMGSRRFYGKLNISILSLVYIEREGFSGYFSLPFVTSWGSHHRFSLNYRFTFLQFSEIRDQGTIAPLWQSMGKHIRALLSVNIL
jgi:hypothetical protein